MKKILSLILLIICLISIGCGKKSGTIEELINVNFNEIDHIKYESQDYDVKKFVKEYKNIEFTKISDGIGSTRHSYFRCYNSKNEIIFTLVSVGNQEKYFIKKGEFDVNKDTKKYLYQIKE